MSLEVRAADFKFLNVIEIDDPERGAILDIQLEFERCITISLTETHDDHVIDEIRRQILFSSSEYQLDCMIFVDEPESPGNVEYLLKSLSNLKKAPWYPYCHPLQGPKFGEITNVPPSDHFYDVGEASVRLVYGAYLEHEVSMSRLKSLARAKHRVTLFTGHESNLLLGAISFGRVDTSVSTTDMPAPVPDGTSCDVTVLDPKTSKWFRFKGVVTPSVISLPAPCNMTLLLLPSDKDSSSLENQLSGEHHSGKQYPCKLDFDLHDENLKAQIEAVNTVCSNLSVTGIRFFALGKVDIFQGLPQDKIKTAYQRVFAMKRWNGKQLEAFQMLRGVPGDGFAFVEGIFGCGKTLVQAVIAKLLVDLGKHVLIVAPTNATLQAISETLVKQTPDLSAVRVVYAGAKEAKKSSQHNDEHAQTGSKDLAVFRLLKDMHAFRTSRYNVVAEHDLQFHVERLVDEMSQGGESLWFKFQPEPEKVVDSDESDSDNDTDDDNLSEEIDAVEIYSKFRLTDFSSDPKFESNEKQMFAQALAVLQTRVISSTKVLLCTQQIASSKLIRDNFASNGKNGIVVIADEDGQSLELVAWILVVLPRKCVHIQAVPRFGDCLQLAPLALSATSKFNEFGGQISRSLFDHHLRHHEPAVSLNMQYRMHPILSHFPNLHTYRGKLLDGEGCGDIKVDSVFAERLFEWAGPHLPSKYTPNNDFARLLGVNVMKAKVITNNVTFSRSNPEVVKVVSDMLSVMFNKAPYPTSKITIMTSYNAQKASYLKIIRGLQEQTGISFDKLPRVATIDSMQGHESDNVILDWVNGYGKQLGFLRDDRRINVALTRARASLIVFFHRDRFLSYYDEDDADKPEVLTHWDYLLEKNLVIRVKDDTN